MNSAAATAAAKSVGEARPQKIVKNSFTSESEPELAESFGEDSSSDKEERLMQLFRNMGPERARRTHEKLRERRERSFLFVLLASFEEGGAELFQLFLSCRHRRTSTVRCHFRYGATSPATQITRKTNRPCVRTGWGCVRHCISRMKKKSG